ncbi:MAG: hypothetical protein KC419_10085, partial [Anaerolineales bacterium]|nr:hypothetical protein [Anaerolineales bacterium]
MTQLANFIQQTPKAEIHIHLEGSIQPATVLKLAERHNQTHRLPGATVQALENWFTFTDFPHFIQIYVTIQDMIRTADDFELIVYECGADMAAQNIRYREITVTPFTHTHYLDKGLTIDQVLAGLNAGRLRAKQDFGVEMRWVFDIPRNFAFQNGAYNPESANITLSYALAGQNQGVVGFGLGGNEVG